MRPRFGGALQLRRTKIANRDIGKSQIAALFLWALVHGLGLLLIDGQIETGTTAKDLVHQVLKLAGTGLNETRT